MHAARDEAKALQRPRCEIERQQSLKAEPGKCPFGRKPDGLGTSDFLRSVWSARPQPCSIWNWPRQGTLFQAALVRLEEHIHEEVADTCCGGVACRGAG